jgi:adenylate kinase family enzyme
MVDPKAFVSSLKIPPPRFILLGPRGAGKTTCAMKLSQEYGVPLVHFKDFALEYATRRPEHEKFEINAMFKESGAIISPALVTSLFHALFNAEVSLFELKTRPTYLDIF